MGSKGASPTAAWVGAAALAGALAAACGSTGPPVPPVQRHQVEAHAAVELPAHRVADRTLTLPFQEGDALRLADLYGNVTVTADSSGRPRCQARIEVNATDSDSARAVEDTIGLVAEHVDGAVVLRLVEPVRDQSLVYVASADLELFVPPGTPLSLALVRGSVNAVGPLGPTKLETGKGDLRVRHVDGGVIARSGEGDVKLRQCTGGPIRASTDSGMIALLGSRTETARLECGRGGIVVNGARGGTFELHARQGKVRLIQVEGALDVECGRGFHAEDLRGGRMHLEVASGGALLRGVHADEIRLEVERANVVFERVGAPRTVARIEVGKATLTDVTGAIEVSTGSGDIDAAMLHGPSATLGTDFGAVRIDGAQGDLSTRTSNGRTTVHGLQGTLTASSRRGPIGVDAVLTGLQVDCAEGGVEVRARGGSAVERPWHVASGRGDITLVLPPEFAFDLEARTHDGVVDSAFPIVLEAGVPQETGVLRGRVGPGGGRVECEAQHGNVALRRGS